MRLPHWMTPWRKATPAVPRPEIKSGYVGLPAVGTRTEPAWAFAFSATTAADATLKSSVWVYACASRRATAMATIPLILYRDGVEVPWNDAADPLARLLRQPMPDTTWSAWVEEVSLYLTLTGSSFLEKYRAKAFGLSATHPTLGLPHEIWPSGAGSFKPNIDKKIRRQVVRNYSPKTGDKADVATSEIVWIRRPRPSRRDEGFSPTEAAEREISTDRQASEWQQVSLQNRGVPDGIISFDYSLSAGQELEVEHKMTSEWLGARNAHRPMILSGAKWLDLAKTHVDLELLEGRAATRKAICAAMDTPEVLFDVSGSTYANLETALLSFMTDAVLPDMNRIVESLNMSICAEFGPDIYLAIDYASVPALLPVLRAKWEVADKALDRGVPMSQVSAALDLGVTEYRGWDVGLVPSTSVPLDDLTSGFSNSDLGLTGGAP